MNGWLLFFYTVPAKPVGSRMRIWRKLARMGAVPLKGAVYLLPASEEHREMLQWLVTETSAAGGEAGFAQTERIFPFEEEDLRALFNNQRGEEYSKIDQELDSLRRKLDSFRKGTRQLKPEAMHKQLQKIRGEFLELRRIDFFHAPQGGKLAGHLMEVEALSLQLFGREDKPGADVATILRHEDFQGRTWVTRPRPFVDRLASAWLISRFIDSEAVFVFLPEEEIKTGKGDMLSFDMAGGDFTHMDDLCTFEVLMVRFGLSRPALQQLAEIVHDLDLRDGKYNHPAGAGVEVVIAGIRDRSRSDQEALEQGIMVFDALYTSYSPEPF
jgi:hypothetical protein